jgi:hypothetical protein
MKEWLMEVVVKKMGPSALRGAVLGVFGWLMARQGLLDSFGVVSDAANHTTTVYWDKLSTALIVALPALLAAVIKLVNHHTETALSGPAAIDPKS